MDEYTVRIQKLKLEDHGIQVIIFNQQPYMLLGLPGWRAIQQKML
jgi:hypothetical protein